MKLSTIARSAFIVALAVLCAGCLDGRYRDGYYDGYGPYYRDDDRLRPSDFQGRDRRFRNRYARFDDRPDSEGTRRLGRTPFRVDARGRLAPSNGSRPRLRIRHGGGFGR